MFIEYLSISVIIVGAENVALNEKKGLTLMKLVFWWGRKTMKINKYTM